MTMLTTSFEFTLEKYKGKQTRFACPGCGHLGTFSRYINTATGEYLSPYCGRCDRELNCGYHRKPSEFLSIRQSKPVYSFPQNPAAYRYREAAVKAIEAHNLIDRELFKKSLSGYEQNKFIIYLTGLFGDQVTQKIIEKYYIGSSNHWNGATVFWQIDTSGRIRAGKVMLYDPHTGKRIKEPQRCITWVHKILRMEKYSLRQCFFGEHLLKSKLLQPVAIVESEKTAVIASAYLPGFIWLASGGLNNLTPERLLVLKGRKVLLYPDSNGYEKWMAKTKQLLPGLDIRISGLLERKATESEKIAGYDLADYLTKYPFKEQHLDDAELLLPEAGEDKQITMDMTSFNAADEYIDQIKDPYQGTYTFSRNINGEDWDDRITRVEEFADVAARWTGSLKLDRATTILDVSKFYQAHLEVVLCNGGITTYLPYLERLEKVIEILTAGVQSMKTL
jgi:hypothetical protein